MTRALVLSLGFVGGTLPVWATQPKGEFVIDARRQTAVLETITVSENGVLKTVTVERAVPELFRVRLDPTRTAVVVCDMWDDHWCKKAVGAVRRAGEGGRTGPEGVPREGHDDHPLPVRHDGVLQGPPGTQADAGGEEGQSRRSRRTCRTRRCRSTTRTAAATTRNRPSSSRRGRASTRPSRSTRTKDYITDSGSEVYSLMAEKGIDTLIVMGVHTNMCVLNRTFAIKQMVKWGERRLPRPRPDRRDVQPEDEADGHAREGNGADHRAHRTALVPDHREPATGREVATGPWQAFPIAS